MTSDTVDEQFEADNLTVQIVDRILKERFSARFYLPIPVPRSAIEDIVDAANAGPSGFNMQPWNVYALFGSAKDALVRDMLAAFHADEPSTAKFDNMAVNVPEEFAARRREQGARFYAALGVSQDDLARKREIQARNFRFFDAPVAFIFTLNSQLKEDAWLDLGIFIQGAIIAARARGLEALSTPRYNDIIRTHLNFSTKDIVACGMAMGYADHEQVRQKYVRPAKRSLEEVLHIVGA
uniref:Nitroreductase n=1 Tax=Mycena chlorophos TaxID=658473 RepID=A0ABQ0LH64_MYCCL|nr:nitroreductase [Mycena chlorophos]